MHLFPSEPWAVCAFLEALPLCIYMQVFLFVAWNRYLHTFLLLELELRIRFFFCILSFIHFFLLKELELHTPSFWNLSCVHFISPATLTWTVHLFALWKSLSCVNLFLLKLELYSRFAFWRGLRCAQWPKLLQKETGLKFQKILLKCQK